MTKEQERAIHLLSSYAGMTHKQTDNGGRPKLDQAIDVVLNLLKEKDKEIETLEKANTKLASKLAETEVNYENLKKINTEHQKQIGEMEVELSKKDKMIDLMLTEIAMRSGTAKAEWKQYFERKCKNENIR